tara:strand:+ start:548 stop:1267 length:720 start_codon:yes stop_codon:yes gene_type:complete
MKNNLLIALFASFIVACSSSIDIVQNSNLPKEHLIFLNDGLSVNSKQMSEKILFPIKYVSFPTRESLLPNAIRAYRNGIHEGIDIVANYNTPVYASLSGVVVVANSSYKDLNINQYNEFLSKTSKIKKTPRDIYTHILLGKYVIIDHGFDFVKGFRTTTTYAHLSQLHGNILSGASVKKGDLIGYIGNTGTKYGAQGNNAGAHLHWEMHFENTDNIYYLGQNIKKKQFIELTKKIFERE